MTKYIFASFLLTLILACSKKEKTLVKFYKDIEIPTLIGREELQQSELDYPYIRIGELANMKIITFFLNRRDTITYEFTRKGNSWFSYSEYNEPEGLYTNYEFITNKQIVQIKYYGDPYKDNYRLVRLNVTSNLQKLEYVFPTRDSLKIPPSEMINSFPLDKANIKSKTTYECFNGIWKMHQIVDLKSSNKKIVNDTCVDFGINSFAWYLHCYFFVPAYDCI